MSWLNQSGIHYTWYNTAGVLLETRTANPSQASGFISGFWVGSVLFIFWFSMLCSVFIISVQCPVYPMLQVSILYRPFAIAYFFEPHRWCYGQSSHLWSGGCGFKPWSGQPKDNNISICCFSANHTVLRRKSKDWLTRYQDNVSELSDMSIQVCCFSELALYMLV